MAKDKETDMLAAVKSIKQAILESQYRAAKLVNREQLALYYSIGKFVSVEYAYKSPANGCRYANI